MGYRFVVQVQTEHVNKAIEEFTPLLVRFGAIHKIPFEDSFLLDFQTSKSHLVGDALYRLAKRGVASNARGEGFVVAQRFNHMGEHTPSYSTACDDISLGTRELLTSRLWPDGCDGVTALLRAECITMRFEWEDQIKNGRRFAMLNLIEK